MLRPRRSMVVEELVALVVQTDSLVFCIVQTSQVIQLGQILFAGMVSFGKYTYCAAAPVVALRG